jgi:hypothetical protein
MIYLFTQSGMRTVITVFTTRRRCGYLTQLAETGPLRTCVAINNDQKSRRQ